MDQFLLEYTDETSSDGGADSMIRLQGELGKAAKKAKVVKIFLLEVFLLKGLKQYTAASSAGDESAMANARGIIAKQQNFLIHANELGITENDICDVLRHAVQQALPALETEPATK